MLQVIYHTIFGIAIISATIGVMLLVSPTFRNESGETLKYITVGWWWPTVQEKVWQPVANQFRPKDKTPPPIPTTSFQQEDIETLTAMLKDHHPDSAVVKTFMKEHPELTAFLAAVRNAAITTAKQPNADLAGGGEPPARMELPGGDLFADSGVVEPGVGQRILDGLETAADTLEGGGELEDVGRVTTVVRESRPVDGDKDDDGSDEPIVVDDDIPEVKAVEVADGDGDAGTNDAELLKADHLR